MRPCFAFTARTGNNPAVLAIDNEIGFWGTQAADFRTQLNGVSGNELTLELNSPGGDVMAGLGMYNMLRTWASAAGRTLTTRVTGVAASIASVVALAGDKREMPSNAFAMVHSVSSGVWGTADEMREHADTVDKIQASVRDIYVARMGIDEDKAKEIMAKDTWLTAAECVEMGFATALVDPVQATASFDMSRADLPEHVAKVFKAEAEPGDLTEVTDPTQPTDKPEPTAEELAELEMPVAQAITDLAAKAGLQDHAQFLALSCATMAEARTRLQAASEIVALCKVAGKPEAAKAHIQANKPIADVRASLVETLANTDVHTDNTRPTNTTPTNGNSAKPTVVNTDSLWASHNSQQKKGR